MKSKANFPILQLSEGPLNDQVYEAIRGAILDGRLKANMKLPSSRTLAEMMLVSRNTILSGIERLMDEGYLITKAGSGTYVCAFVPEKKINCHAPIQQVIQQQNAPKLSEALQSLMPRWQKYHGAAQQNRMFSVGVGCVDLFPQQIWGRILGRVWRHSQAELAKYSDVQGYQPLREALAQYMRSTRGLNCNADQIMIVNGTQQAINLTSRALLNSGDGILIDDPGYDGALGAFQSYGLQTHGIASDEEGMLIPELIQHKEGIRLVYTAPSHQFPLGGTLSLERRLMLLDWAKQKEAWIFEDDYNGEFRYHSRALQALQGLDQAGRVIYSGTFSKMFYPGFRLAFLVLPQALIEPFKVIKHYADSCNSYLEQAALAAFIQEGEYAKYVRKARKACLERQQALVNAIEQYLPHVLTIQPSDSGIHAVAWLKDGWDIQQIMAISQSLGLGVQPLYRYSMKPLKKHALLLGYAAHQPHEIAEQIKQLAEGIKHFYVD